MSAAVRCRPAPTTPHTAVVLRALALSLVLVGLGWMFGARPAYAATHVWSGGFGENGDWSATANWSSGGGVVPGETVDLVFPAGVGTLHSTNDRLNVVINSITFEDGGYTIDGTGSGT